MQACCVPGTNFLPPLTGKEKLVREVIIHYELTFSVVCEVRSFISPPGPPILYLLLSTQPYDGQDQDNISSPHRPASAELTRSSAAGSNNNKKGQNKTEYCS